VHVRTVIGPDVAPGLLNGIEFGAVPGTAPLTVEARTIEQWSLPTATAATTGYRGVYINDRSGHFYGKYTWQGIPHPTGTYDNAHDAAVGLAVHVRTVIGPDVAPGLLNGIEFGAVPGTAPLTLEARTIERWSLPDGHCLTAEFGFLRGIFRSSGNFRGIYSWQNNDYTTRTFADHLDAARDLAQLVRRDPAIPGGIGPDVAPSLLNNIAFGDMPREPPMTRLAEVAKREAKDKRARDEGHEEAVAAARKTAQSSSRAARAERRVGQAGESAP